MQKNRLITLFIVVICAASLLTFLIWSDFSLVWHIVGYFRPHQSVPPAGTSFLTTEPGVSVSIFAENLSEPRVITFDPRGRVLVSEMQVGRVTLLEDTNDDGITDVKTTVLEDLNIPHGLAFYTDPETNFTYLYVAEVHQVARYLYDISSGAIVSKIGKNVMNFPKIAGQHTTRTIGFSRNLRTRDLIEGAESEFAGFGSSKKLYASVGSTCDVCIESSWKNAAVLESDPEGSYTAEFAGGLRNSVFFAFHPVTSQMWVTEMGRDNLGDNLPPDEINIIIENGKYGWPFCYGSQVRDISFVPAKVDRTDIPQNCADTTAPIIEIPAHSAPLGIGFVPEQGWPSEWQYDLIVAFHGSWNRSIPTGYKIVRYDLDKHGNIIRNSDGTPKVYDFITGWYDGKKIYGRPVDIKFADDGTLYITDDAAGRIYRVTYTD